MSSEALQEDVMGQSVRNAKAAFTRIEAERLRAFIEAQPDVTGPVTIGQIDFPSDGAGSSNGIGLFDAELDRGEGRRTEKLVVRYSPGAVLLAQKSFVDEFATLSAVHAVGIPSPRPYWLDPTGETLGAVGYVMERIDADKPTASLYSTGPFSVVDTATRNEMMLKAAGFHGSLRKAAIGRDKVPHLADRGPASADGAVARELGWWLEEVHRVANADPAKRAYLESLHAWLIENQPSDLYEPGLVHGDAQFANLMFRNGQLVAALDWELSFLGHNESDIALLAFLTESQKVFDKPASDTPTEADFIARFEAESGHPACAYDYFRLFCMFKVQSIALMTIANMPSPDIVWNIFLGYTDAAWDKAREAVTRGWKPAA